MWRASEPCPAVLYKLTECHIRDHMRHKDFAEQLACGPSRLRIDLDLRVFRSATLHFAQPQRCLGNRSKIIRGHKSPPTSVAQGDLPGPQSTWCRLSILTVFGTPAPRHLGHLSKGKERNSAPPSYSANKAAHRDRPVKAGIATNSAKRFYRALAFEHSSSFRAFFLAVSSCCRWKS